MKTETRFTDNSDLFRNHNNESFRFGALYSMDYGIYLTGISISGTPERDLSYMSVAGRNGDLLIDNKRWKNIDITYHCAMEGEIDSLDKAIVEQSAEFDVMSKEISMKFTTVAEQVQSVDGQMQTKFNELYKYIKFSGETAITIGSGDNAITLELDNETGIVFKKNGVQFGLWDGDEVCIFEDTVRIYHSSDGTRSVSISLSCKGQASTSLSGYTLSGSGTAVLDTIVRSATLSVDDGTLGTEQTITVKSDSSSLTYTVKYSCGTKSGTICTKSSSKSIKWTPPLELAEENTTGVNVSVKLSLTTYSGSTSVGTDSETIQCAIPDSVKPSFTAEFTDAAGYKDDYGTFIQHLSKLHTVVSASSLYGATIKAYKITANGETFTEAECTTGVLTSSGDITVQIVVTDTRERTAKSDFTISVTAHTLPVVSSLSVHRCDGSGNENDQGAYVKVTFSASADPFDSKNTVAYKLEYKKSSAASYTVVNLTAYNNNFAISGKTYIFSADTGSSYDVRLTVTDAFSVVSKSTTASTAATIMHFKANGKGLGLGKVAEVDNAIDVGWPFQMNGHTVTGLPAPASDSDAVPKNYVTEQIQNVKDEVISLSDVYPVGAIYLSTKSTSPASLFGGSWTQLTDRFLIGAGSSYAVDATGGAATVALSTSQMPKHNHILQYSTDGGSSWSTATMGRDGSYSDTPYLGTKSSVAEFASYQVRISNTGSGSAHNNMPPYLAVYMWKRIA